MCRYTTRAPAPAPTAVHPPADIFSGLPDDFATFNWFDAIDDIPPQSSCEFVPEEQSPDCNSGSSTMDVKTEQTDLDLLSMFEVDDSRPASGAVTPVYPPSVADLGGPAMGQPCLQQASTATAMALEPQLAMNLGAAALLERVELGSVPVSATWMALRAPYTKSGKSPAEASEAVERIKQKRRESAQRSRARKNAYMRALEVENKGLKDEIVRLRDALAKLTGPSTNDTTSSQSGSHAEHVTLVPVAPF